MRASTFSLAVCLLVGTPGCLAASADEDDGPLEKATQTEIDGGIRDYLIYTLLNGAGSQVGKVLVTVTTGGSFAADREYWYLTSNLSNSAQVTFSGGSSQYWSTPPSGLGTLSFTTVRTPTWTLAGSRGTMLVYSDTNTGEYDAINWQMSNATGSWTGSIYWYHDTTGNLFGPGVSRTLTPTSTSGTYYHYVSTPL